MEGSLYMNMKEPGFLQTTSYILRNINIFLSNFKKNIKNCFL